MLINFFFHLLCLTTIYLTVKASRPSGRRQIELTKPAIDDFLDKLLDSAKFDVVADKIAEKAVDRIMQNLAQENVKKIERTQVDTGEIHNKENEGSLEIKTGGLLGISADNGSRVFKIKTEALIGKYATLASDEISLNYKRFTHGEMKEKTTPRNLVFDEKRNNKQGRDSKRDSRERNIRYDDQSDDKRWSDGYRSQDDNGYRQKIRDKKGHGLRSFKHRTGNSDADEKSDETKPADEKSVETKPTAQNETTKAADLTNKDSSDYDSDNNKVSQNNTTEAPDIDTRSIIRKDGEKLFAFQESPDYDDYHDNLSKLLKLAKKKNGKRSNTSKFEK